MATDCKALDSLLVIMAGAGRLTLEPLVLLGLSSVGVFCDHVKLEKTINRAGKMKL